MVTDFGVLLLQHLNFRKKSLLKNAAIITAVYLDPRVRLVLSEDEIIIAKMTLEKLHEKVQEMKKQKISSDAENSIAMNTVDNENDAEGSFEKYMASKAGEKNILTEDTESNEVDFYDLLSKFEVATPFHNKPVLAFWEDQKEVFPQLYDLASIINSIPPTQATEERSFSMLNFIFTCRRYNLGQKMLQGIMTIKLNVSILREINERDLQEIAFETNHE